MILRFWRGKIAPGNLPAYQSFLAGVIFPKVRKLKGNLGAELMVRHAGEEVDVIVETRWAALDDIHAFAGENISVAVVEPEARALLKSFDDYVTHYEIALGAGE
jgi:hypothetical protein